MTAAESQSPESVALHSLTDCESPILAVRVTVAIGLLFLSFLSSLSVD